MKSEAALRMHTCTLEKFLVRHAHMQAGRAHLAHTPFKATSQVYPQPQLTPLVPLSFSPSLHAGSTWAPKDTFWKDHEADLAQDR